MTIKIYKDKLVLVGHAKTSETCSALSGMIQAFRLSHPLYSELIEEDEPKGIDNQIVVLYKTEESKSNYNMIVDYIIFLNQENKDYTIEYIKN